MSDVGKALFSGNISNSGSGQNFTVGSNASSAMTVSSGSGDLNVTAAGGNVKISGDTGLMQLSNNGSGITIRNNASNDILVQNYASGKDIVFKTTPDGGTIVTPLTLNAVSTSNPVRKKFSRTPSAVASFMNLNCSLP